MANRAIAKLAVVDIDGVIADFVGAAWTHFEQSRAGSASLPTRAREFRVTRNYFFANAPLVTAAMPEVFAPIWLDPDFWLDIRPYQENIHSLRRWLDRSGNQGILLTSRPSHEVVVTATRAWLDRQGLEGLELAFGGGIYRHRQKPSYERIGHSETRPDKCAVFADLAGRHCWAASGFIDDHPENVRGISQAFPLACATLLARPWNRAWRNAASKIPIAGNLAHFLEMFDRHSSSVHSSPRKELS